jgi:hypothetical protein
MPVQETLDGIAELRADRPGIQVGGIIVNMAQAPALLSRRSSRRPRPVDLTAHGWRSA